MSTSRTDKNTRRVTAKGLVGVPAKRLYSVPIWLSGRSFAGGFDYAGGKYNLVFAPSGASTPDNELELLGRLTITDPRGRVHSRNSVRAKLASIQGGIGDAPVRRRVVATGGARGDVSTSQQKQQTAAESEKAGQKAEENRQPRASGLPVTESTGPTSFTGVMYFHLEALDGRALGVPVDLSRVQLNLRLDPLDETTRTMTELYRDLVDALHLKADANAVAVILRELNQLLRT
ncbi:MAG TPA: hypothetical protein VKN18_10245 [Blastocatellia bacterium]|nr:hypothetical protein [Blastocatellia bacterium]